MIAGGATPLEYVVLGSMRHGVVYVHVGYANHQKCYHWIQLVVTVVYGQDMEESVVVGEVYAAHQTR